MSKQYFTFILGELTTLYIMGAHYQAITNLKQIVVESNISFKSWSAGKITSPVTVWTVCIWKKVISLQFPCLISFVKSI